MAGDDISASLDVSLISSLILWELHIMHPNSTHFPVPSSLPLTLAASPPKIFLKIIIKPKENKEASKQMKKPSSPLCFPGLSNISSVVCVALEAAVCHMATLLSSLLSLKMVTEVAIGLIQGLCFLVLHPHWTLTETPLGYLSAGPVDPLGIVPQDQFLHELQQAIHGWTYLVPGAPVPSQLLLHCPSRGRFPSPAGS